MLILRNEINQKLNNVAANLIAKGFLIKNASMSMAGILNIRLIKQNDSVTIEPVTKVGMSNPWEELQELHVRTYKNDVLVGEQVYYTTSTINNNFYTTKDEVKKIARIHKARWESQTKGPIVNTISVTRKNIKFIRNISGWKTVPMKNVRVYRKSEGYYIENVKNGHSSTFETATYLK